MPSPVGHILGGAAVYLAATRKQDRSTFTLGVAVFGSILPDFDFLPGLFVGKLSAYHHGISHSLTFAVLFGAMVFLFVRRIDETAAFPVSMLAMWAYASHVIFDFVGVNEGTRGVPIFWPLSDEKFGFSLNLFGHFRYGDIRDGLGTIVRWDNLMPVLREILVVGSIVLLLFWRERRPTANIANSAPESDS